MLKIKEERDAKGGRRSLQRIKKSGRRFMKKW